MLDLRKTSLLDKYLNYRTVSAVADIGSGDCRYVKYITTRHYGKALRKAIAIDKSPLQIELCRKNLEGINLSPIILDLETEYNINTIVRDQVDIVLLFDILEHLSCPRKAIELAKLFQPELIFISTIGEPTNNIRDAIERDPEHVVMFNRTLLSRFLKRLELEPLEIRQDHEILFAVARL